MSELKYKFTGNSMIIYGISIYEDPYEAWNDLLQSFGRWSEKLKEITIDFKFKGYSSTTSLYITKLVKRCEQLAQKKNIKINWYYLIADEDMEFKGEIYQDMTKKAKFNLIGLEGAKIDV